MNINEKIRLKQMKAIEKASNSSIVYAIIYTKKQYFSFSLIYWIILYESPKTKIIFIIKSIIYSDLDSFKSKFRYRIIWKKYNGSWEHFKKLNISFEYSLKPMNPISM